MSMPSVEDKLEKLKISLPDIAAPAANYVPYTISGNQVFISGQICKWNGEMQFSGKVGREFSIDEAKQAARICGLNIIYHLKDACSGDLNRVKTCLKLNVFINSIEQFNQQPEVANGVSDLMIDIFGEAGKHARSAVSVLSLPSNSAIEVDACFEIK
ncbi:MAG: RidA family protein [Candidatus Caenarcaniphilales bacterium]|nr:RidA family protein [Candidatus Caenarcaniphilales bacterium]